MKRNNIFMWAYISFIVICAFVRLFIDFSLWIPIVLAIAISGVFFAIEDLFVALTNFLDDFISISEQFVVGTRENINKDLLFIAKTDEKIKVCEIAGKDISDIKKTFEPIKTKVETMNDFLHFENKLDKRKRDRENSRSIATIFAYLGFLCLLCLIVLLSYYDVPTLAQEIVTVVPFVIILITRQISDYAAEKLRQERLNSQEVLQKHTVARNKLLEAEE